MPAAIIGGVIAGAGAIGSAVIGSNAAKSAANTAANTASQNNALQSQIYQQNTANLTPWMQRGNAAGQQMNALLGLAPSTSSTDWTAYAQANPQVMAAYQAQQQQPQGAYSLWGVPPAQSTQDLATFAQQYHAQNGGDLGAYTTTTNPADAAKNAFNQFTNSDGYQFRLGQGINAVNNNYATHGALNSGAALKALNDYAQGQASNEFGKYMGYLDTQDQRGMAAGSAIAGVGQNYANAVSSNNNNAASAAGNAAIASGNAWSNGLSNAAGAIGGMFNSSYGGGGVNMNSFNNMVTNNDWSLSNQANGLATRLGY